MSPSILYALSQQHCLRPNKGDKENKEGVGVVGTSFRLISSTLCRKGQLKWLEQQLDDHHKALSEQLKMNLSDTFTSLQHPAKQL